MSECESGKMGVLGKANAWRTPSTFGETCLAAVGITPPHDCLHAIAGSKFWKDVVQMEVDGRVTYPKLVGDFLVKKSFRQQGHDLIFAGGQQRVVF